MPFNRLPDGVEQYYEVHGDRGRAIVFAHGGQGNHIQFYRQVAAFQDSHRVVVYDQRGHGRTGGARNETGGEQNHTDLLCLLDLLGLDTAVLVGHSLGGWAVSGVAQHAPGRVAALVMSGTAFNFATDALSAWAAAMIERIAGGFHVLSASYSPGFAERAPEDAVLYGMLQRLTPDRTGPVGLAAYERMRDQPSVDWSAYSVPTWFIVGENDGLTPPALIEATAAALASSVAVVPDAGHATYFEQPQIFNHFLRSVLATL
jgi:3-oxoadipate enol-lactonase